MIRWFKADVLIWMNHEGSDEDEIPTFTLGNGSTGDVISMKIKFKVKFIDQILC